MAEALTHIMITWALSPMALQVPFVIWDLVCAHDVADTPHGEVHDIHPHQMKLMPSSTTLVIGTPILKLPSFIGVALCFPWDTTPIMHLQIW